VSRPCPEVTEEEEAAGDGDHSDEDLHEEDLSAAGVMVIDDDPFQRRLHPTPEMGNVQSTSIIGNEVRMVELHIEAEDVGLGYVKGWVGVVAWRWMMMSNHSASEPPVRWKAALLSGSNRGRSVAPLQGR
jgi:hypothetical protein